jgi:hypothetical protein
MRAFLSIAVILLVGAILYMVHMGNLKDTMRDLAMVVVGVVLSKYSDVYGFYFGSSDGSKQKTEQISDMADDTLTLSREEHGT